MTTTTETPAAIILRQLGGAGRLKAMLGAGNFMYSEKDPTWLSFRFKGCRAHNFIRITLDPSDTYTVQLGKIRGYNFNETAEASGLYADQLKSWIEGQTGLYLTL